LYDNTFFKKLHKLKKRLTNKTILTCLNWKWRLWFKAECAEVRAYHQQRFVCH